MKETLDVGEQERLFYSVHFCVPHHDWNLEMEWRHGTAFLKNFFLHDGELRWQIVIPAQ